MADGLPMPPLLQARTSHPKLIEIYESLKPSIQDILHQNSISFQADRLCYRFGRPKRPSWEDPAPEEPAGEEALIISSNDTDTSSWHATAKAILLLFQSKGIENFISKMQVEIRNPDKAFCHRSAVLPNDPGLCSALEGIKAEVSKTVHAMAPGLWSSTAYHTGVDLEADPRSRADNGNRVLFSGHILRLSDLGGQVEGNS